MKQRCCLKDQILMSYVDSVFLKYDKDNSRKLDELEMAYYFNDIFVQLGIPHIVTPL